MAKKYSRAVPFNQKGWRFWIDRGGTFTDVVACHPNGSITTEKLLSSNPGKYEDPAEEGIRRALNINSETMLSEKPIIDVRIGTTIATNALLERKGERTLLLVTKGFKDALRIGYQSRPKLFDLKIDLPPILYDQVIEVNERISADGSVLKKLDQKSTRTSLERAYGCGFRSVAILFMHGYQYNDHEARAAEIAAELGFNQISTSHGTSPLMKFVGRGDTTVADAYLTPSLRSYVDRITKKLGNIPLYFMQSHGGLTEGWRFQGKDAILSGPAAGVIGAVSVMKAAGLNRIISFDMGGTSTDVAHYGGEYERSLETKVDGIRIRAPMMQIHTIAAGGGSICSFEGGRYRVGPASAGAEPGPACYRKDGPLTVTDCNLILGKLQPDFFPKVFGPKQDQSLDKNIVIKKFGKLAKEIHSSNGDKRTPTEVAEGFLRIAVDNMANGIRKISVQKGHDVTEYALCSFGGAGGQHACLVADALGLEEILVHPMAGVLSAYGIGLAHLRVLRQETLETGLNNQQIARIRKRLDRLSAAAKSELVEQGVLGAKVIIKKRLYLKYVGTDIAEPVNFSKMDVMRRDFEAAHRKRYGFTIPKKELIAETLEAEAIARSETPIKRVSDNKPCAAKAAALRPVTFDRMVYKTAVYRFEDLTPGVRFDGPAIIAGQLATTVVEPGWQLRMRENGVMRLRRITPRKTKFSIGTECDPVMLEIFNNLFVSIAEQMGFTLQNTASSVNIKERLDFSCALFDSKGHLIANAPHVPVHLGSMSESVRSVISNNKDSIMPGDVFALNAPYNGGTHLPDVTVITPVFNKSGSEVLFFLGSRGHQADIGGITPGSVPPLSRSIEEEGVVIDNFKLVKRGSFQEQKFRDLLGHGKYPARNPDQNIADIKAQIAANETGASEIWRMIDHFGLATVQAYMDHVQMNAEEAVRKIINILEPGEFVCTLDNNSVVKVRVTVDRDTRTAKIDFTGTSEQCSTNFNAPLAVCRASVLYVFRTLVSSEIPMNEGCLKPLKLIVPEGSMLNPRYPAAVVAGNVEISQAITDALYGALGIMAGAQGTMNNITFGNESYQYYETICGGSGAGVFRGVGFNGVDAVQTHMTNSRLTDPEVLESRFPVLVEKFEIRDGSGGTGKWRGGNGVRRRLRFEEAMTLSILSGRRKVAPHGQAGGCPGSVGQNWIEYVDGTRKGLPGCVSLDVSPGDVFEVETPGGGGFGKK